MFATKDSIGPPLVMGILNCTPDSFSDGGLYSLPEDAATRTLSMFAEGADFVDIGGESTRPGAIDVDADTQIARIVPVIEIVSPLLSENQILSVDTRNADVAERALSAGARIVNDVDGGRSERLLQVVAGFNAGIILTHKQGNAQTMQDRPAYQDVVSDVVTDLLERTDKALQYGVNKDQIAIDPGIGFGKTLEHNVALLQNLYRLVETGLPIVLGTSRKSFLKKITAENVPAELVGATGATTTLATIAGVRVVRVHDVKENSQAAKVAYTLFKP